MGVEHVEFELIWSGCGNQHGDGVLAIGTMKEADVVVVEVGVRALQKLERRAAGVRLVGEIVAVFGREGVASKSHVDGDEEEVLRRADNGACTGSCRSCARRGWRDVVGARERAIPRWSSHASCGLWRC